MMKAMLDIQTPAWMQVIKERFSTFKNQWSVLLVMARYSWLKLKNQTSKYFLALIHCILPVPCHSEEALRSIAPKR